MYARLMSAGVLKGYSWVAIEIGQPSAVADFYDEHE